MRATNHSSREWGLARHNDRDFDIEKADHIDPGKQDENYYWNYYPMRRKTPCFSCGECQVLIRWYVKGCMRSRGYY